MELVSAIFPLGPFPELWGGRAVSLPPALRARAGLLAAAGRGLALRAGAGAAAFAAEVRREAAFLAENRLGAFEI